MVRKPLIKRLEGISAALVMAALASLSSCNPTQLASKGNRSNAITNKDGSLDGKAYIFQESPFIIAGPNFSVNQTVIGNLVNRTPQSITENNKLTANCSMRFDYYSPFFSTFIPSSSDVIDCIRQMGAFTETTPLTRNSDRTFIFPSGSNEFYQTNTLYHLQQAKNTFLQKLQFAYNYLHGVTVDYRVPKSIPPYLRDSQAFWFKGVANTNSQLLRNSYLNSFASCDTRTSVDAPLSAYFSPAGPVLCFGVDGTKNDFRVVQDISVVYHEFGHAMVSLLMNLRNSDGSTSHALRSNLGHIGYDEARALNEGIADYFSYIMNKRAHMGEWLGKISNQSRPMSEDDPKHIPALSTTSEGRLSYPDYLLYDPNDPEKPEETEHYAGSIVAHYLVAFTEQLKNQCGLTSESDQGHKTATDYTMLLLAETLSELGDLEAKGVDDNFTGFKYANATIFFNNLDKDSSFLWTQHVNQPNYRRFFQIWAKNTKKYITDSTHGLCPNFTKDESEKLLDDYGLLLFKTYNDNGNSTKSRSLYYENVANLNIHNGVPPTAVSEDNRRKTVLVSKSLLDLAANVEGSSSAVNFYIIDNRTDVQNLLQEVLYKGLLLPLTNNVSGVDFNNSNIKISPGEVVALIPNLYNSSNTPMAGVQLLANDWDHVNVTTWPNPSSTGNFKPCVIDEVTTVDQGGEAAQSCTTTDSTYRRLIPTSGVYPASAAAPVCMVELDENGSSRWVSQNEFRKKSGLALQDKDCLGFSTSSSSETDFSFNPHECLVRFLPGANEAFFSRIDPLKTYFQTAIEPSRAKKFNPGNLLIMEVNKWIPPGTKFRCRMRAKFSNCSDCFTDGTNSNDDFLDSDFNGAKPFKVINFEFDVND